MKLKVSDGLIKSTTAVSLLFLRSTVLAIYSDAPNESGFNLRADSDWVGSSSPARDALVKSNHRDINPSTISQFRSHRNPNTNEVDGSGIGIWSNSAASTAGALEFVDITEKYKVDDNIWPGSNGYFGNTKSIEQTTSAPFQRNRKSNQDSKTRQHRQKSYDHYSYSESKPANSNSHQASAFRQDNPNDKPYGRHSISENSKDVNGAWSQTPTNDNKHIRYHRHIQPNAGVEKKPTRRAAAPLAVPLFVPMIIIVGVVLLVFFAVVGCATIAGGPPTSKSHPMYYSGQGGGYGRSISIARDVLTSEECVLRIICELDNFSRLYSNEDQDEELSQQSKVPQIFQKSNQLLKKELLSNKEEQKLKKRNDRICKKFKCPALTKLWKEFPLLKLI